MEKIVLDFLSKLCSPMDPNSALIVLKYLSFSQICILLQAAVSEQKGYLGAVYEGRTAFKNTSWYTAYSTQMITHKEGHPFEWYLIFVTKDKLFKFNMAQLLIDTIDVKPTTYESSIVIMMIKRKILIKNRQRKALRGIGLLELLPLTTRLDELLLDDV